ncbi:MAG: aldehyde dehydrogenase family protein [Bradymonadia bacterium]
MHNVLSALNLSALNPGTALGGEWLGSPEPEGGACLASTSPTTGEVIAEVQTSAAGHYDQVIDRASEAAVAWAALPAPRRGEAVRLIGEALRQNKLALGRLVALENGKIEQEGLGEVQEMIDIADFAVGQSRMLYGKTMHSERPGHRMYEQWHPLGIVGVITAFNFPVAVWAWNACIAAICGNVTIWKPSPKTPLTAIAVQRLVEDALAEGGFPPAFFLLTDSDASMGQRLVHDERVKLLSFTGSTAVGKTVAAQVAGRLGRSLLELGGNNALIIDETADLSLAIPATVFGAVGTAGQRCTTTRRLLVHRSRLDEVCDVLVKAYAQVRIGDPLEAGTLMGPLIDDAAVARFSDAVARARALGGEVLYGGDVIDGPGHFVQPTLIKAEPQWDVVQQETFAPILYIMAFDTPEEAIAIQNNVPQGLSSALFTTDLRRAERFLSAQGSDCGIANVNIGTSGAEIGGAFGGEKETGGGREAGSDAWKAYMRRQTNTINYSTDLPLAQGIKFTLG